MSENVESTLKLFADDTSLFSVVHDSNTSVEVLSRNLQKISEWAHKWKMSFNPDVSKRALKVIFSRKQAKSVHPDLVFNNTLVHQTHCQKHLGVYLDMKLNFKLHFKEKISKAMKGIGIIKKLSNILPRKSLITIYKSFVRPHFDYGDLIYDQPNNESFCQQIESVQYNASLAITGAIKGTSKLKLYNEIGLESLKFRRWFRILCTFYKIKSTGLLSYLFGLIPKSSHMYNTRSIEDVATLYSRTDSFKYSFFPFTTSGWNKLDLKIQQSKSLLSFRNPLIKIGRPIPKPIYNVHNPVGLKLLTRLRLGHSHLNQHKSNHNLQDCLNPFCSCRLEVESVFHFFLHCHYYLNIRSTLLNELQSIDINLSNQEDDIVVEVLLYGSTKFNTNQNFRLLSSPIDYTLKSERFSGPLL